MNIKAEGKHCIKIMNKIKTITREQKTQSLCQSLLQAGYDMAASQAENMAEDKGSWGMHMIEGQINPKCIDICDQAGHAFYNNELDIWFEPDEEVFPDGCDAGGINELIENNGISDDEVFDLLYEGAANYINETYGEDWKEKFPEPQYNK